MFNLYPNRPAVKILSTIVAIFFVFTSMAQCPSGSVSPTHNTTYGSGIKVCLSGTFNGTITINNGAELIINNGATFTGRVYANSGSLITVNAGGTFTPGNLANFAGKIVNAGTAVFGSASGAANGAIFENSGVMSFNNGFNYYGTGTQIKNLENATMYYNYNFQFPSGGVFSNNGTLYTKNFTVSSGAQFLNRGKAYIIGNLSLDGKLVNDYLIVVKGNTSKQASDSLINYSMMVFDGNANFNGGVRNEGLLWFTSGNTRFHNGSLIQNNPNALTRVNSHVFYNNAAVSGVGGFYSAITPVHSDGSFKGSSGTNTLMTNFPASSITNNSWSPSSNTNLNGVSSASFPLFDTLNYIGSWANPASPYAQPSMLPIVMSDFSASPQASAVLVNWNTLSEVNGQYMVLQHSTNGSKFNDLYTVQSNGSNTSNKYQYKHLTPSAGTNYYRIMMVSMDNGIKYTGVVAVKFATALNKSDAKVYPNPFTTQLQVKYTVSSRNIVSIRLISSEGKIVMNKLVANETTGNHTVSLNPPAGLKPGIYFMEINTGEGIVQQKIVKQ
ncbi:T9SS type A sorting domain-containing protein [Pollutibacter soli]|uniref:T9SS type A sorting domain-containing protein n=1 Tax=Pollutibacter soli TaxID=3034157 RepID=UPI0030135A14